MAKAVWVDGMDREERERWRACQRETSVSLLELKLLRHTDTITLPSSPVNETETEKQWRDIPLTLPTPAGSTSSPRSVKKYLPRSNSVGTPAVENHL